MTEDDKALVERLRGDWPEILVEKHWMMDSDAIDKQREEAADRIEALSAENERLREALRDAIRFIDNLIYDIKSHTECDECQQNVAMYEGVVKEYRAALGETE